MKKNFIYLVAIVLVGVAVFVFVNKANNKTDNMDNQNKISDQVNDVSNPVPEGEWIKLENGLQYKDVTIGTGQEAKNGDSIVAHYNGTFENGTKFDSSYDRGEPFSFILGGGTVIKGWDLGILDMKVGGKRKLIIPAELGYGDRGAGGVIPPGATLLFDVELVGIGPSLPRTK